MLAFMFLSDVFRSRYAPVYGKDQCLACGKRLEVPYPTSCPCCENRVTQYCRQCGYDIGEIDRADCPECGEPVKSSVTQ